MSEIENSEATGLSEAILKSMPEALIFSDLEGIIRVWNVMECTDRPFGRLLRNLLGQHGTHEIGDFGRVDASFP